MLGSILIVLVPCLCFLQSFRRPHLNSAKQIFLRRDCYNESRAIIYTYDRGVPIAHLGERWTLDRKVDRVRSSPGARCCDLEQNPLTSL